jgi:hypothetical protein
MGGEGLDNTSFNNSLSYIFYELEKISNVSFPLNLTSHVAPNQDDGEYELVLDLY